MVSSLKFVHIAFWSKTKYSKKFCQPLGDALSCFDCSGTGDDLTNCYDSERVFNDNAPTCNTTTFCMRYKFSKYPMGWSFVS